MARVEIDETRCKGCGLCTLACPKGLVRLNDRINVHGYTPATVRTPEKCTGCALCAEMCPDVAIIVHK